MRCVNSRCYSCTQCRASYYAECVRHPAFDASTACTAMGHRGQRPPARAPVDRRQMPQLCEIDEKCHVLHMCYNVLQCATMCYIFESKIRYCVIGNQCRIGRHMPPPPGADPVHFKLHSEAVDRGLGAGREPLRTGRGGERGGRAPAKRAIRRHQQHARVQRPVPHERP